MYKNMLNETFKEFPYNSRLLVGSKGTIKNNKTGKVIKQIRSMEGYYMIVSPLVCISVGYPKYHEYVHRLVALTYVHGYSKEKWICHHKDNNRCNNNPENLIWVTKEEHEEIHGFNDLGKAA